MSTPCDGFALPPGWREPQDDFVVEAAVPGAPIPVRRPALDPSRSALLLQHLSDGGSSLQGRSVSAIAASLGAVGARFSDAEDELHRTAVARVAKEASLSLEGAREVVVRMAEDWTADRLVRALRADFPDPRALDGFVEGPEGQRIRAVGGRFAFHVCSGNVPGVGVTSMIRSLLVKCPVLVKPGRTDIALPVLFARALVDQDETLAGAVAVVYWPHQGSGDLEALALATADRVVAYGGNQMVEDLRGRTPVTTPFLAYHHRLSVAVIGRSALDSEERGRATARRAAAATGAYDTRGCVSPKVFWVEESGAISPSDWAELLAAELERLEERLPAGPLGERALAALRQHADSLEIRAAAGEDAFVRHAHDFSWVVVFGSPDAAPPTGAGRGVLVSPIADVTELADRLTPAAQSLQSVGMEMDESRLLPVAEALARIGVTRVTDLDGMAWPPAWWRHDGQGPLSALVRWTTVDQATA